MRKNKNTQNIGREKQILQDDPQEKHRDLGVLMFSNKGSFFLRDELIGLFLLLQYRKIRLCGTTTWKARGWSQFRWHPLNPVEPRTTVRKTRRWSPTPSKLFFFPFSFTVLVQLGGSYSVYKAFSPTSRLWVRVITRTTAVYTCIVVASRECNHIVVCALIFLTVFGWWWWAHQPLYITFSSPVVISFSFTLRLFVLLVDGIHPLGSHTRLSLYLCEIS
jgi:hypothetical protein